MHDPPKDRHRIPHPVSPADPRRSQHPPPPSEERVQPERPRLRSGFRGPTIQGAGRHGKEPGQTCSTSLVPSLPCLADRLLAGRLHLVDDGRISTATPTPRPLTLTVSFKGSSLHASNSALGQSVRGAVRRVWRHRTNSTPAPTEETTRIEHGK